MMRLWWWIFGGSTSGDVVPDGPWPTKLTAENPQYQLTIDGLSTKLTADVTEYQLTFEG